MSRLRIAMKNPKRMRYQKDTLSATLCLLAIVFNIVYFVGAFRNDAIAPDIVMGADVLVNIVFMMITFLTGEKLKVYAKGWAFAAFGLGIVEFARIFVLPQHYAKLGMLTGTNYIIAVGGLALAGLCLTAAGANALVNSRLLKRAGDATGGTEVE